MMIRNEIVATTKLMPTHDTNTPPDEYTSPLTMADEAFASQHK
jgi:hypothetical protein